MKNDNIAPVTFILAIKDDIRNGAALVMELSLMGDLNERITLAKMLKDRINSDIIFAYFYQIVMALESAHSKFICHRDIKPHNIVVDTYRTAKLIDFGVSK